MVICMRNFKITLKSGEFIEVQSESREEVLSKVLSGQVKYFGIRDDSSTTINQSNLDTIEEIIDHK